MKGYIYSIINQHNGKRYVGKTIDLDKRLYDHLYDLKKNCHHSHKLQRAFNKYGEQFFKIEYEIHEVHNIDELDLLEIQNIEKYNSYYEGYNETLGGEGHQLIFNWDDSVILYNILQRYDGIKRFLSKYYNCDASVFTAIQNNKIYAKEKCTEEKIQAKIQELKLSDSNLKENYVQHNKKKLKKEQCFEILSVITSTTGYDKSLCEIFDISSKMTYRLRRNMIYKEYIKEFNSMTPQEKEQMREQVFKKYNLEAIRSARQRKGVTNPLTQEQVNFILKHSSLSAAEIGRQLSISADRVRSVRNGISYKDLVEKYYSSIK